MAMLRPAAIGSSFQGQDPKAKATSVTKEEATVAMASKSRWILSELAHRLFNVLRRRGRSNRSSLVLPLRPMGLHRHAVVLWPRTRKDARSNMLCARQF
jgi:hypothetical protein